MAVSYWNSAVADLGIDVVRPFQLTLSDGDTLMADALVREFGAPNGMLVFQNSDAIWPYRSEVLAYGYGWSSFEQAGTYDRDSTIEMLADWQWNGPEETRPHWLPE